MGDGYWDNDSNTVFICTDSFSHANCLRLIELCNAKFRLIATLKRRIKENGDVCYRVRFSGQKDNLLRSRFLVEKHMYQDFLYKLNIRSKIL